MHSFRFLNCSIVNPKGRMFMQIVFHASLSYLLALIYDLYKSMNSVNVHLFVSISRNMQEQEKCVNECRSVCQRYRETLVAGLSHDQVFIAGEV